MRVENEMALDIHKRKEKKKKKKKKLIEIEQRDDRGRRRKLLKLFLPNTSHLYLLTFAIRETDSPLRLSRR